MKITLKQKQRFAEWMKTHEPHDVYILSGEAHPADQVAELMGIEWPQKTASVQDHINTDIEEEHEDLGDSHESGDTE